MTRRLADVDVMKAEPFSFHAFPIVAMLSFLSTLNVTTVQYLGALQLQ